MTTENDGATLVRQIVTRSPVFVLLKGDVEKPFCRFSKQLVHLLLSFGISFHGFNVLSVREQHLYREFKEYAQFPTFPQLYVAGALVGGLDICQELLETGELLAIVEKGAQKSRDPLPLVAVVEHGQQEDKQSDVHADSEDPWCYFNIRLPTSAVLQCKLRKSTRIQMLYDTVQSYVPGAAFSLAQVIPVTRLLDDQRNVTLREAQYFDELHMNTLLVRTEQKMSTIISTSNADSTGGNSSNGTSDNGNISNMNDNSGNNSNMSANGGNNKSSDSSNTSNDSSNTSNDNSNTSSTQDRSSGSTSSSTMFVMLAGATVLLIGLLMSRSNKK